MIKKLVLPVLLANWNLERPAWHCESRGINNEAYVVAIRNGRQSSQG
ncbi:MAG TPA: hypothetical protein VKN18_08110 [Blastocatellia bacterium]|nr:hypothetical protein [Blastocatellia bacterium]